MSTLKGLTCISYELDQRADLMLQFEWRKCPDAAVFQTKPRNFYYVPIGMVMITAVVIVL